MVCSVLVLLETMTMAIVSAWVAAVIVALAPRFLQIQALQNKRAAAAAVVVVEVVVAAAAVPECSLVE